MKTVKHTFSENSLILIVSTVLVKIIGAIFKIPLASDMFLGDLGFGYYSVAHDIFMPFYILAISGLPSAISQLTAEYVAVGDFTSANKCFKKSKKLFLILGILFSIATIIISLPILFSQETSKNALYSIFAILPSIFLCFIISAYRGYFEGYNNMYPTAVSKIIEAVFKLVLGLVLSFIVIKITNNPAYASAAALLAISFGTLFATVFLSSKFKSQKIKSLEIKGEEDSNLTFSNIFALALPYVLASLSASVVSVIDLFTVKTYIANASDSYLQFININSVDISTHLYGLRSKAFTLYYLIPTITMSLGVSAIPIISEACAVNDFESIKTNANFSLKLISFITFPAAIGLAVLSKPIMELLYSSNDSFSANLLFLYGIAAIFAGFSIPLTSVLQVLKLQKHVVITVFVGIIIKTTVNLLSVMNPNINIYSAPFGTIACYFYITVSVILFLKIKIKCIQIFPTVIKPLLCASVCGVCAYLVSSLSAQKIITILAIFTAVLVYFTMIFLTKTFTKNELLNVPVIKKFIK